MPVLIKSSKQILILGLFWSPICLGIVFLHVALLHVTWWQSASLIIPLVIIQFFIALSVGYICRLIALDIQKLPVILLKHFISAIVINVLWIFLGLIYSSTLDRTLSSKQWILIYNNAIPLLLAVGLFIYLIACLYHYLVIYMERTRTALQQVYEQRLQATQAELRALKASIHPHFLFNSLTALSALIRDSASRAETTCNQLAEFLQYSLRHGREDHTTVGEEIEHIKNFLAIEKTRLGERLSVDMNIEEDSVNSKIPSHTLLPLVENAVKHGIGSLIEGGTISIHTWNTSRNVVIEISNLFDPGAKQVKGEGLGLKTVKAQLAAYYGSRAALSIVNEKNIFTAKIILPLKGPGR